MTWGLVSVEMRALSAVLVTGSHGKGRCPRRQSPQQRPPQRRAPVITFARVTRRGRGDRHGQARAPPLDERVHGVDGRRGLGALVAFVRVFLFLAAVLADEGAVFVELSVPALPVVHQAVVALVAPHRAIGRRPAALQRLVVLRVTRPSGIKVRWKVTEKQL